MRDARKRVALAHFDRRGMVGKPEANERHRYAFVPTLDAGAQSRADA